MSTNYISDWTITDSANTAFPISFTVFHSKEAAQEWVDAHEADLTEATRTGTISGVHYQEARTPARFITTTAACLDHLAFGSRVVSKPLVQGVIPVHVVGIPERHVTWLCGRLRSALVPFTGPYRSLEEATEHAQDVLLSSD